MLTPEEFKARHEAALARVPELRSRVVRAERWDQLFPSPAEAETDFIENLINADRFYYKRDDPAVEYIVEPNPRGDIHRITRNVSYTTTYQCFLNGDVALTFYYPDKSPSVNRITPSIGNIDHPFTTADVLIPDTEAVDALLRDPSLRENMMRLTLLFSHLRGKPATQGWEETILYTGYLPQRIGYRLFPDYTIEALAKVREEQPKFIVV